MEQLVEGPEEIILKKIKKAREKDKEMIKAVEETKKVGVKVLRNEEWQIEKGNVYIPKDENLKLEIIQLHHDTPIVGYRGQ